LPESELDNVLPYYVYAATPLMLAARAGHTDIVKMLLEDSRTEPSVGSIRGSPIDVRESPALSWAAAKGHKDVVKVLLDDGRVDPRAGDGTIHGLHTSAALKWAARGGYLEIVRMLLEDGRVKDSIDVALRIAQDRGHIEVAELLKAYK